MHSAQCVLKSSQYVSPVRPLSSLIGSFSPLINSANAGCAEPSWDKCLSIDQILKRLTNPSGCMSRV